MARRDPSRIREARRLFGRNGLKRDAEAWTSWLRDQGDDGEAALMAIAELVSGGAHRGTVVGLSMDLHATEALPPASLDLMRDAAHKATVLRADVRALAKTQARDELYLGPDDKPSFEDDIIRFVADVRRVRDYTRRGERFLFNKFFGPLVTHVVEATGNHADDLLADIVKPIIRRPFETAKWRERNKAWWSAPKNAASPE
jgi:hypothetical protein